MTARSAREAIHNTGGHRWRPAVGAFAAAAGTRFRVWAPTTGDVELVIEHPDGEQRLPLVPEGDGMFSGTFAGVGAGTRYRYVLDGDGPFPDPASRFQPDGVHGASLVVDPEAFQWSDGDWSGVALRDLVLYELHVGTFTAPGRFADVSDRLSYLKDLGVTGVELMPVADFPGERNWGYDGAALFAPARCYGSADDLRRLVDTAHGVGLAVLLDVVYNHTGPDGAYLSRFSPYYFTSRHESPWGAGIDLDGEHSAHVREFFIENALHWVHEYHLDGLRLDATHAIHDNSPRHFLAELAGRVRETTAGRQVHLIAEDHRNLALMVTPEAQGGWGLDAVWADDLHHQMRRLLAGDDEGYYRDFSGTAGDLAATLRQGWFFTGQYSQHLGVARGTDPAGLPPERFVVCLQNHDQIGNRAFGERLHHQIAAAAYRAASVVLLTAPQTPLLFMGQEWAASSPFQFFTDHNEPLGRLVTEGRRREFGDFSAFADPAVRATIPDPQALATFLASRLNWSELAAEPHASVGRLYAALLALRRQELSSPLESAAGFTAEAAGEGTIVVGRAASSGLLIVVACLRGAAEVDLWAVSGAADAVGPWTCVLTSEDADFAQQPAPPTVDCSGEFPVIRFPGPAAVVLRSSAGAAAGSDRGPGRAAPSESRASRRLP